MAGVTHVEQGFIRSEPPEDASSEAVIVHFDPTLTSVHRLVQAHLHTHSSTSNHAMRGKYRSAVYSFSREQAYEAKAALAALQPDFVEPLITRILPFVGFEKSDPRFQNYFASDPERPFCRTFIRPKLETLKRLTVQT